MKLNPDCIRDILLAIEDTTDYYTQFEYVASDKVHEKLKQYNHDEIVYHIHQCSLAGLIRGENITLTGAYITVEDLTPAGHEFLANIRKNWIWERVKDVSEEIGTQSLSALVEIAKLSLLEAIKKRFNVT